MPLLLLLILSACGASPAATPSATQRPVALAPEQIKIPAFEPLSYGIQTFVWWNPTLRGLDLEHVRLMDFDTVKQIFDWAMIQPLNGSSSDWSRADEVVNEVTRRNLKLVARVDHAPDWARRSATRAGDPLIDLEAWGRFCGELAGRYKGKIAGYQIWNEPNLAREWFGLVPDAAGYAQLLKACYTAIKTADPNAVVISAGLAPTGTTSAEAVPDEVYLLRLYSAGFAAYHDVLGVHAPGYKSAPQTDPADPALDGQRWQSFRHVEDVRAIQVAQGDGAKQIAILEMGWTLDQINDAYKWIAVTEAQQAAYLVGAYQYAAAHWRPWVGLMVTIYLPDPAWTEADEQYWWSIATPGYNPTMRPAFFALSNMAKVRGNRALPARDPGKAGSDFTPMPSLSTQAAP